MAESGGSPLNCWDKMIKERNGGNQIEWKTCKEVPCLGYGRDHVLLKCADRRICSNR